MPIPKPARFRAYAAAEGREGFQARDADGKPQLDDDGNAVRGVNTWPVEDVAFEGKVRDGKAEFDAGKVTITRVVFYAGDPEAESVVESFEVNASGVISVGG